MTSKATKTRFCVALMLTLSMILTGCATENEAERSVGPNSDLPPMEAPTGNCEALDDIFEKALIESETGAAFVAAQAETADKTDPDAASARDMAVRDTWIAFLEDFWAKQGDAFSKAAGTDKQAIGAAEALENYTATAPPMLRGEVPQFLDDAAAIAALEAGEEPKINPEFTKKSELLAANIEALSSCMPSWPVIF